MSLFEFVCFQKEEETKPSLSLPPFSPTQSARFFPSSLSFRGPLSFRPTTLPQPIKSRRRTPTSPSLTLSPTGGTPPVRVVPDLPPAEHHPVAAPATASPTLLPLPRASCPYLLVRRALTRRRPAPSSSSPSRNGRPPKLHRALMVAVGVPPPTTSGTPPLPSEANKRRSPSTSNPHRSPKLSLSRQSAAPRSRAGAPPSPSISSADTRPSSTSSSMNSLCLPLYFGSFPTLFRAWERCLGVRRRASGELRRPAPPRDADPAPPATSSRCHPHELHPTARSTQATESNSSIPVNKGRRRQFF
jgi:hypothetical protein